jgi:hypothetical protein
MWGTRRMLEMRRSPRIRDGDGFVIGVGEPVQEECTPVFEPCVASRRVTDRCGGRELPHLSSRDLAMLHLSSPNGPSVAMKLSYGMGFGRRAVMAHIAFTYFISFPPFPFPSVAVERRRRGLSIGFTMSYIGGYSLQAVKVRHSIQKPHTQWQASSLYIK